MKKTFRVLKGCKKAKIEYIKTKYPDEYTIIDKITVGEDELVVRFGDLHIPDITIIPKVNFDIPSKTYFDRYIIVRFS